MPMKKSLLLVALTSFGVFQSHATLSFYDSFDYTTGQLLAPINDTTGTPNPGQLNVAYGWNWRYAGAGAAANKPPGIASGGLSYPGLQPSTGNSVLFDTTQIGTARIQAMPAAISSGTVYWSGLIQVGAVANLNAVNGMLLGGFVTSADAGTLPGTVGAVLRIRQSSVDTTAYNIGVGMNSGTTSGAGGANVQFDSVAHAVAQTVFVVASYEFVAGANNDIARMWINPNLSDFGAGTPPLATLTSAPGVAVADSSANVLAFNLRNVNTVGTPTGVLFDELRVGTTWADVTPVPEPAAAGLLGLCMLVLVSRYRSRCH